MEYSQVIYNKEDSLAIITFNRPEVRNALSHTLMMEFGQALGKAEADDDVRVVIVTGAGDRAFAAGADIGELQARDSIGALSARNRARRAVVDRLESLLKPSVAAINGAAVGGGCEIAMACTLRIAADSAKLGQPEINIGIIPGLGGTQRLTRLVGRGSAMELVLLGDLIDAQEAYRIGLVNKVVPAAGLMEESKKLARKLASKPPVALRCARDAVNLGYEMNLAGALEFENRLFALTCGTEDKAEGVAAFLEKRKPSWHGR
ncbi:MAG: hypothetical protein EPO21_18535 [Chloroflexota bacterium]|nr:MAG: hypothetical protein EPO21_18535 [Chloroflexota bacterium]